MKPVVVDASAIVEYLLRTPLGATLEAALGDRDAELHVPALCDVEVASVVRRALLARRLGVDRAYDALEDYLELPLARHGHTYLLSRVMGLRCGFSAYDAVYLALAEWLEAAFVTTDERLARAVQAQLEVKVL